MPITISGSTGIAGVDGSASTPAVQGTDTNTGIAFPAADTVAVATGGTERMRVDSSGNVGIGTSAPTVPLQIYSATAASLLVTGDSTAGVNVSRASTDTTPPTVSFRKYRGTQASPTAVATGDQVGASNYNAYDGTALRSVAQVFGSVETYTTTDNISGFLSFTTRPTGVAATPLERMRIDSSGNLLVLTSSTLFASSHAFVNSGAAVLGLRNSGSTAGKYWQVGPDLNSSFKVYNQSSVGMFMSDGSTSWSSSSDERQKNIIEPISNAVAKVGSLRAVIGSYKADEENRRRSFLIAQDVEQALPEAVTTAPDGFLGVAYTDVIPLLVAAIQEQQTHIAALEARLTALEAK